MHKLSFFPLGNADCSLIELENEKVILIDYANMRSPTDTNDKKIDLPKALNERVAGDFDVVCFTHADSDHIKGFSDYFYLNHTKKYQDGERKIIKELWVPAAIILETGVDGEQQILRAEARHRLKNKQGIRVFSNPDILKSWCEDQGMKMTEIEHLLVNAGKLAPGFKKETEGVEFFVHSPFSTQIENETFDRNNSSIVLQATFGNRFESKVLFGSDIKAAVWKDIVNISKYYGNQDRLNWDVFHVSHHSSYTALAEEKGVSKTKPIDEVKYLFEDRGNKRGFIVSPSLDIPTEKTIQPPHKEAAAYYRGLDSQEYIVTMEYPTKANPKALTFKIDDEYGVTEQGIATTGTSFLGSNQPPRNG